jgi:hypothetical protein
MSTAAVSSTSTFQQLQGFYQQRTADLKQLGQALQSGDLAGAQKAFTALQNLSQSGPLSNSNTFSKTQRQTDFAAIGQALQSGDLAGAQQAFAQLQSTFSFKNNQRVLDPGPAVVVNISAPPASTGSASTTGTDGSTATASTGNTQPAVSATAPPAAAPPELVINLSNSGGPEQVTIGLSNTSAGEQLTISVAGQQGTSPEQLAINLGPNTGQQIVLNLFNSTSTTPSTSTSPAAGGVNVVA